MGAAARALAERELDSRAVARRMVAVAEAAAAGAGVVVA
jgi:hypothetical protein